MELFDDKLAAEFADDASIPPDRIDKVRCDVVSCAYHDGERFCTADCITVGTLTAHSRGETSCRTYENRQGGAAN